MCCRINARLRRKMSTNKTHRFSGKEKARSGQRARVVTRENSPAIYGWAELPIGASPAGTKEMMRTVLSSLRDWRNYFSLRTQS
jgi:hypothetical protein